MTLHARWHINEGNICIYIYEIYAYTTEGNICIKDIFAKLVKNKGCLHGLHMKNILIIDIV